MGASEQLGGQPPHTAERLKQEDCELRDVVNQQMLDQQNANGFDDVEDDRGRIAADRRARLLADRDLVDELRKTNFEGPRYEVFAASLVAYGLPVIRAWIRRREIYQMSRDRGRPVECPDSVREHLATDVDDRLELAMEIVANGLVLFRRHALVEDRWSAEGGASLKTYFVGACLAAFPNVFRAWRKEKQGDRPANSYGLHLSHDIAQRDRLGTPLGSDPAQAVVDVLWFSDELASMPERVRYAIAAVVLRDADYSAIAEELGMTAVAVKQMLYRYRSEARRRRTERRQA